MRYSGFNQADATKPYHDKPETLWSHSTELMSGAANKEDYYLTSQLVLVCDSLGAAVLSDPFFIILFKK